MPDTYGADIRHGLNYAVFKGWAVQAASGRLEITDAGRKELEVVATRAIRLKAVLESRSLASLRFPHDAYIAPRASIGCGL